VLRVISGKFRGLKLESLPGLDTRPTLDRVKEALFSMLFTACTDAVGLDLFAGSGALGIELLSRYGNECTFVDLSSEAVGVVRNNVKKAGLEDQSLIIQKDAISFLQSTDKKYDIIFMDPPYLSGLYDRALSVILERGLLNPSGIITLECAPDYTFNSDGYNIIKDKTYGKVRLCLLEAKHI